MQKLVFTFWAALAAYSASAQNAPETGGTGYIQNQSAENQPASFRINGTGYFNASSAYTNAIRGFIVSANQRSGLITETNGSINYGVTGLNSTGFCFRWLSADNGIIDYSTDANELMRLTKTGRLGIGTTNPGTKMHLYEASAVNTYLSISNTNISTLFGAGGTSLGLAGTMSSHPFGIYANAAERVRITVNGDVGIGTTAPAYKLDVNGSMGVKGSINMLSGTLYSDANNMASFHNGGFVWSNATNTSNKMLLTASGELWLYGKMTIGSMGAQKDLDVNGNIKTRKVTVTQTAWPDYVFDSSYQLRPLQQVEQFLKENKHLPDVPSAETVYKDGLNVGENQAALLKKIEELTLYIIQQNKDMQEMKKEIKELKAAAK